MKIFDKEDYLLISGIQHFAFCKHQWGLIHIENEWNENERTFEGSALHENADNPFLKESRGNTFFSRAAGVVSDTLKMRGVIDVIEFVKTAVGKGMFIPEKKGWYEPCVIEYKRGKPKTGLEDKLQLAALAIAFEEMNNVRLEYGCLYYFGTRKRERIDFDDDLRNTVFSMAAEMRGYFQKKQTPPPIKQHGCKACSLEPICSYAFSGKDARKYIENTLEEM